MEKVISIGMKIKWNLELMKKKKAVIKSKPSSSTRRAQKKFHTWQFKSIKLSTWMMENQKQRRIYEMSAISGAYLVKFHCATHISQCVHTLISHTIDHFFFQHQFEHALFIWVNVANLHFAYHFDCWLASSLMCSYLFYRDEIILMRERCYCTVHAYSKKSIRRKRNFFGHLAGMNWHHFNLFF